MITSSTPKNRRIIVIDDNAAIHADFRKILGRPSENGNMAALEEKLFGPSLAPTHERIDFEIDTALQGQEGCQLVKQAREEGRPYAMAFLDVRMPPGWDGIETATYLWKVDPSLQVVLCTAYSDYSWEEIVSRLGSAERFLILKKPFDSSEVRQLALSLTKKWATSLGVQSKLQTLEASLREVDERLREANNEQERNAVLLQHAQKLKALGELAGSVAQEIKKPLGSVIRNLEFMKETINAPRDELPIFIPEIHAALRESTSQVNRIRQIARDLKVLVRSNESALEKVDVNQVLDATLNIIGNEIARFALVTTALSPLPPVRGSSSQVGQILLNLLGNTRHAFEEKAEGNCVRISSRQVDPQQVLVEIADNGRGISGPELSRLFDPTLEAADVAGKRMGLPISQQLARSMGGEITVESAPGRGSTFRIYLPTAHEESAAKQDGEAGQ